MKNLISRTVLLAPLMLLTACMSMMIGNSTVKSLSDVKNDEVILVGKIKLKPSLHEKEQFFSSNIIGAESSFKNKIFIAINDKAIEIRDLDVQWIKHFGQADLEKTFFMKTKRANILYNSGAKILLTVRSDGIENILLLPGGLKYHVKASDKAIYIGTIKYHRDDFNEVIKVELLNEYKQAKRAFQKKFGKSVQLKRVKIETIKP